MPTKERVHAHQRSAERRRFQEERRRILKNIGLGSLLLTGIGAAGYSLLKSVDREHFGSDFAEINEVYPEIANLPIKEMGVIQLSTINIKWFNFSDATFDQAKAAKVYEYLQEIPSQKFMASLTTDQGLQLTFQAINRKKSERLLILVPGNAPSPAWALNSHNGGSPNEAATTGIKDGRPYYTSFVRIFDSKTEMTEVSSVFTTVEKAVNRSLFVEICQSVIDMQSVDPVNSDYNIIGQELACNSLGATLAAKNIGLSYEDYIAWINRVTNIRPLRFSPNQYNNMPFLEFPIKTSN